MMDAARRTQRDAALALVDRLIRRGDELSGHLQAGVRSVAAASERNVSVGRSDAGRDRALSSGVRAWQQECATAINELSGGSKAHWLARAFSAAFLVPSTTDRVVAEADVIEIVNRLLGVLRQAGASLQAMDDTAPTAAAGPRFDFVHNAPLRPVLEQAYRESGRLLEQGSFDVSLLTSCSILEAIITDALEHLKQQRTVTDRRLVDADDGNIGDWSFAERIAHAEKAGLIRGGCARLPPAARTYRHREPAESGARPAVTERDARLARQVLHVIMRDLDPGR
jgi:hypothetical protein